MGVLDKLFFWRQKTLEIDTDIEGCFTLPGAEIGSTAPVADAAGKAESLVEAAADHGEDLQACALDEGDALDAASDAVGDEGGR